LHGWQGAVYDVDVTLGGFLEWVCRGSGDEANLLYFLGWDKLLTGN